MIFAIWAEDKNHLIGKDNHLPWNIKEELIHFKNTTLNNNVLFGRKTFENLPTLLKNRQIYVLTKNLAYQSKHDKIKIIYSIDEVIQKFKNTSEDIYICGGAEIYKLFWNYLDKIIMTKIKGNFKGNIYFPKVSWNNFKLIKSKDYLKFIIKYYERKQ